MAQYEQIASSSQKAALVNDMKRQPRGTFAWRANDSLRSMLWKDRKSILFLLSIHQPEQGEPAKRKVKCVNIYPQVRYGKGPVLKMSKIFETLQNDSRLLY